MYLYSARHLKPQASIFFYSSDNTTEMMIRLAVKVFAQVRQAVGKDVVELEILAAETSVDGNLAVRVDAVIRALASSLPELAEVINCSSLAVNWLALEIKSP
eukprot:TRINITY_DN75523_c0_g1_i1.p1 TRINITY_DN75523_c0_g1~~TRINITY_DN75523_c0_g1_i1.p1  ORF type:complete len:102 (-),score=7.28 TRINITY_DN75523_c0_g1_i1:124-429(-)